MANMRDVLWSNVPEALKNNDLIREYINAIGDEFEDIRQDIDNLKYANDYARSDPQFLNDISFSYGIEYPRNVKNDPKRLIIRDAPDVITRLGTRKALEWVLKFIGIWEYEIGEIWVPNPGRLRQGYYKLIGDNEEIRYDVNSSSFQDFYVGEAVAKENGTFFAGYPYQGDPDTDYVEDIPIYGEQYKNISTINFEDVVSKTPYVVVRAQDYDWSRIIETLSSEELQGSENEQILLREQDIIISRLINYFIQTLQRTATTRVLLILDSIFSTTLIKEFVDNLEITYTDEPIVYDEVLKQIDDIMEEDGVLTQKQDFMKVGNNLPIGGRRPHISPSFYSQLVVQDGINEHQTAINFNERRVNDSSTLVGMGEVNQQHYVFTDIVPTVEFTAPSDSDVDVSTKRNGVDGTSETFVETVAAGGLFFHTFNEVNAVILTIKDPTYETINIEVTYT